MNYFQVFGSDILWWLSYTDARDPKIEPTNIHLGREEVTPIQVWFHRVKSLYSDLHQGLHPFPVRSSYLRRECTCLCYRRKGWGEDRGRCKNYLPFGINLLIYIYLVVLIWKKKLTKNLWFVNLIDCVRRFLCRPGSRGASYQVCQPEVQGHACLHHWERWVTLLGQDLLQAPWRLSASLHFFPCWMAMCSQVTRSGVMSAGRSWSTTSRGWTTCGATSLI